MWQSLETGEFIRSLKRFIAPCQEGPVKIYSNNGKTFVGTEKWLKQVMREEQVQDYFRNVSKSCGPDGQQNTCEGWSWYFGTLNTRDKAKPWTRGDGDYQDWRPKLQRMETRHCGRPRCWDRVVRVAQLRAGITTLGRAVQQLYPLELTCDRLTQESSAPLNPEAPSFRPRRDAAVAVNIRIKDLNSETD